MAVMHSYNKAIDGLRGFAALNVVIGHFIAAFVPALLSRNYPGTFAENTDPSLLFKILQSPVFSILYNGHFAVLVFFVLSGYVLTIPYFLNDTETLKRRLLGRYIRLNLPIAVSIILSFIIYSFGFYSNHEVAALSGSANWLNVFFPPGITVFDFIKSFSYKAIALGDTTFNPPLWSLKIEFIGSLYLLGFYICTPEKYRISLTIICCVFLYIIYKAESIYFIAIFMGALLNNIKVSHMTAIVMFVLGLYFGAFQFDRTAYDFWPAFHVAGIDIWERKTCYNALGAILLTCSVINGFGAKFFQSNIAELLGKISFSIYLLHVLVLLSVGCTVYLAMPLGKINLAVTFSIYLAVSLSAAILFQKFIDKPAIHTAHRVSGYLRNIKTKFL